MLVVGFIAGEFTREELIDAMVNEWIVDCYCAPEEGDPTPDQMRKEYQAMSDSDLLEKLNFDDEYTIFDYMDQYRVIADGYLSAFNKSVDDLQGCSDSERSFVEHVASLINKHQKGDI